MKNVEDIYPLSPLQESLLYHALSERGSTSGFQQSHTTLKGEIDFEAFAASWRRIVAAHPILRTLFIAEGVERPLQAVRRNVEVRIGLEDWRGRSGEDQERALVEFLAADRRRGFDLTRVPLMRWSLLRIADDGYVFVWSYHHLLVDAWSHGLLLRQFFAVYEGRCRGEEIALPIARPFRDYIAWTERQDQATAKAFWRLALAKHRGPTALRIGWPPLGVRGGPGAAARSHVRELARAESAEIAGFARRHQLTPNCVVHGAWAALLSRYGGETEVLFGITVSGRSAELDGIESMVGMFVNNLPMPAEVRSESPTIEWLSGLQERLREVLRYEHCSLAQIQEWSGLPAGRRLFESLLLYQNFPAAEVGRQAAEGKVEILSTDAFMDIHVPISLVVWWRGPRLLLGFSHRAESFEGSAIARLAGHYKTLLEGMAARPGEPLGALPLLSAAERHQLTIEWTGVGGSSIDGADLPAAWERIRAPFERGEIAQRSAAPGAAARLAVLGAGLDDKPLGAAGEVCLIAAGTILRTGARGRWCADGRLEPLGRLADRRAVRGIAVEPGWIEAAFRLHPAVQGAVVVDGGTDGEEAPRLAVRLDLKSGAAIDEDDALRFLRRLLPDAPAPDAVVFRASTPAGKEESQGGPISIPPPGMGAWAGAPRSVLEARLAKIWAELLALPRLGIHENLLELGAQSLAAIRFTLRARAELEVELPLHSLFDRPTIAGLAESIERAAGQRNKRSEPELSPVIRAGNIPLSFSQQRLWFLQQLEPESPAYNIPESVRVRGPLAPAAVRAAFGEIVRRHEALRTRFTWAEEHPVQEIVEPARFAVPEIDLERLPETRRGGEYGRLRHREARRPFDLAAGPLLRVLLVAFDAAEHSVLFTLHHIISDAWSMGVLVGELRELYQAAAEGLPSPLPELPIQYADFAVWQRRWLSGARLDEHLDYWLGILGHGLVPLELPSSRPRPARPTHRGATLHRLVSADLARGLERIANGRRATLFMGLLTVFAALLARRSRREDLLVATEVANRNHQRCEPLIGFFVNMLALRIDLAGDPGFSEALDRVRAVCLGAFAHQDLPFDKLVEHLDADRRHGDTGMLRHVFVLENAPRSELSIPGLATCDDGVGNQTSKFDLLLVMETRPDGLAAAWNYSLDLFEESDIAAMARDFEALLTRAVASPDEKLSKLGAACLPERKKPMDNPADRPSKRPSLGDFRPQAVELSSRSLVRRSSANPNEFPLVIEAAASGVNLAEWAGQHVQALEADLLRHGAILFRGFDVESAPRFEDFCTVFCPELYSEYGDLPRLAVDGRIYESTPYPADKAILMHNESSHLDRWPLKQWFCCMQPAARHGETPLVDCRRLYQRLAPEVREKFATLNLAYVRNLNPELDLGWRQFFLTDDRAKVEERCRQAGFEFAWMPRDGLRIRSYAPAVARHPKTGEMVFFNQIQAHHISCLEPEVRSSLLALLPVEEVPRNVYYGDLSTIDDRTVEDLRSLYDELAVCFPWERGDVLMVDNMLVAHGRHPFEGQRKILVAMGEMFAASQLTPLHSEDGVAVASH